MIGATSEIDEFVTAHRWAVITTLRSSGHPSNSVVAYARDGDTLVVSTPGGTLKHRTLTKDSRVTLTIICNAEPFNFVTIEGEAEIESGDIVEATRLVFQNIADTGYEEPEDLAGWIETQSRVIIRVHPERVTAVIR